MDIRKREIRRILNGFSLFDGEYIAASSNLFNTDIQGAFTGSFTSRFFGLTAAKRQYKLSIGPEEAKEYCRKAFSEMGRKVRLTTAPDALAIVFYPHLHNPFLMTAELEGKQMLVHFYSARTPASLVFAMLSFSKWEKKMPADSIQRAELITMVPQIVKPEKRSTESADDASEEKNDEGRASSSAEGKDD